MVDLVDTYPMSCGEYAWAAIEPTRRLFAAARAAGLPVFYSTNDTRSTSRPTAVRATKRRPNPSDLEHYAIRPEFKPQLGDAVITKQRASIFFGTPLAAHLTQLGARTVIMCGESTSGCVRASAVDAYSLGYHVVLVEECCFDRNLLSHKVSLFDLHHKYCRRHARRRGGGAPRRTERAQGELTARRRLAPQCRCAARKRRARRQKFASVCAVDTSAMPSTRGRTEVALERLDDVARVLVEGAGQRDAVAVAGEPRPQLAHRGSACRRSSDRPAVA